MGISPENLSRIFNVFQQLSEGSTRTHQGAGIGLALSRWLIEAQGGRIGVASRLAFGSVFHLILPLDASGAR